MSARGLRIRQADTSEIWKKCRNLVPEIQLTDKYLARISDRSVTNFISEAESTVIAFAIGKNKYKIVAFFDRGNQDSSPIRFEKKWCS